MSVRRGFSIIELLVVIVIISLLVGILVPAVQYVRTAGRQTQCKNNLKQLALAMQNFETNRRYFPPGVSGTNGTVSSTNMLHTWNAHILPFLEQSTMHDKYDFTKPFDDPANATIVKLPLETFLCPELTDVLINNQYAPNHYAGNGGTIPGANDGFLFPNSKLTNGDLRDGLTYTIMIGELAWEVGGWAQGTQGGSGGGGGGGGGGTQGYARSVLRWWSADAPCATPGINPAITTCNSSCERKFQFSSLHPSCSQFAYADGHVDALNERTHPDTWKSLVTRDGGEKIEEADFID